jgi:Leucine-rich repeat (LRR) protein
MVNAQEWLDEKYPNKKQRQAIEKIDAGNQNLEGDLDLDDFSSLKEINVSGNPQLGEIINTYATIKINAQEWLDREFPDKQETELKAKNQFLIEGELVIANFPNLEKVDIGGGWWSTDKNLTRLQIINCPKLNEIICNYNLTELNLNGCSNLKKLNCSDNKLTNLDLTNNLQLEELDISNNNFPEKDLTFLSRLVNLKGLKLGNCEYGTEYRISQNIYNRFIGSLEPLKELTKLEYLSIDNIDINSGAEYLPKSLSGIDKYGNKKISFSTQERPKSKVREIAWQLGLFADGKQKFQKNLGFTVEEINQWMESGLTTDDYDFAVWLKNERSLSPTEVGEDIKEYNKKPKYKRDKLISPKLIKEYNSLSWKDIHPDFNPELKKEWENQGFNYEQAKKWVDERNLALRPEESNLAKYLQEKSISPEDIVSENFFASKKIVWTYVETNTLINKLREEYNSLGKENFSADEEKNNQQIGNWEDIHEWFGNKYSWQKKWENLGFDYQQTKELIDKGLSPLDYEFAYYLEKDGHHSQLLTSDIIKLRRQYNPQTYLDFWYPLEKRKTTNKLNLKGKYLKGNLTIDGKEWEKLQELDLLVNELSSIVLKNLPKLKNFEAGQGKIENLTITDCPQLQKIDVNYNSFANLDFLNNINPKNLVYLDVARNRLLNQDLSVFSEFENLETLRLGWNADGVKSSNLRGSLEPLKNLTNLKYLDISGTDIDSGLEFLPENLETLVCRELEECANAKIAQELQNYHLTGGSFYSLQAWRKFNSAAQNWLDENYPENGECQIRWGKNEGKEREKITELDISYEEINRDKSDERKKIKLKGGLRLKGFTNLRKLNCSNHQLIFDLDLSDCKNLVEIKCSNNEFESLNFLKPLNKLEKLSIQNNQNLEAKDLNPLSHLANLKYLDISNCPKIEGSLKSLEENSKLGKINISRTNINEGVEYLPESCKELHCELDYNYKSMEITKELGKQMKEKNNCYNLDKWRIYQANSKTASTIPLERLFVIRGNLKQFINKWGKKPDNNLFERLYFFAPKSSPVNELGKLQSPEEYTISWNLTTGAQWINRAASVIGGGLLLVNADEYSKIGGTIAIVAPFVETATSYLDDKVYNAKETKWNEYLVDADIFSDNFNELSGMTKAIKFDPKLGEINKEFENLKNKVERFLDEYDNDGNQEIDLGELVDKDKRKVLAQDLIDKEESKLQEIIDVMKQLEKKVIAYRQGVNVEKGTVEEEAVVQTETENLEAELKQQIKEEIEKIKAKEQQRKEKLEKQQEELKNNCQRIKKQLEEKQRILSFLKNKPEPTSEESNLLNSLKEKIKKLVKNLSDTKEKIEENEKRVVNNSNQTETHPEIVIDKHLESNNSQETEHQNLSNKHQAQIVHTEPFGIPGSSK